jgi:hypothetical protein
MKIHVNRHEQGLGLSRSGIAVAEDIKIDSINGIIGSPREAA